MCLMCLTRETIYDEGCFIWTDGVMKDHRQCRQYMERWDTFYWRSRYGLYGDGVRMGGVQNENEPSPVLE